MTRRHLLSNLICWRRAAAEIAARRDDGAHGRRANSELWAQVDRLALDLRAERLAAVVNRYNLAAAPRDWLPVDGKLPLARVSGLACPWHKTSRTVYSRSRAALECFYPGSFARWLVDGCEVAGDQEHEPAKIFARRGNGEIELWEDLQGLRFKALLPDTATGREVVEGIESGRLVGVSIAFDPNSVVHDVGGAPPTACIYQAKLTGVALTCRPAYHETAGTIQLELPPQTENRAMIETTRRLTPELLQHEEQRAGGDSYVPTPAAELDYRRRLLVEARGGRRLLGNARFNPREHEAVDEAMASVWK